MSGVSVSSRRIAASLFVLMIAALLYGGSPVDPLSPLAGAQPRPTFTPPRGHSTTTPPPHARPTHTPNGPKPKPTDPYPAGARDPVQPRDDSFFVASDALPESSGSGASAIVWIALAVAAMVFAFRWFVRASLQRR